MEYSIDDSLHKIFVTEFPPLYESIFNKKLERLRHEEAQLKEKNALKAFSEEELKLKEIQLRRERMRLEEIRTQENEEKRKLIEQKMETILGKAKISGYEISEERVGKEVVYQLIRRG